MGSKYRLSELCLDINYGFTASASIEQVGPKFLRITDIQGGEVNWDSVPYCFASDKDLEKNILKINDIVIARTGNSTGENYIYLYGGKAIFASYLIRFRVNPELANPYFIWLQLRTKKWFDFISSVKCGSAQAGANAKTLGLFEVELPNMEVQTGAVSVYKGISEKITLNRQMNQTLEEMAQALFKSWFVDFDPVVDNALDAGFFDQDLDLPEELLRRAEMRKAVRQKPDFKPLPNETRQLFPAAFEECAEPSLGLGGWVPEGWTLTFSGEHIDVRDGTHDSPKKADFGFPLVTSKNLTSGKLDLSSAYPISPEDFHNINKRSEVSFGDVLTTMIGTIGISCLVSTDYKFAIKNVGLFRTSSVPLLKLYFSELLKSKDMQRYLESMAAGTTQRYLSLKVLRNIPFILPCAIVLDGFNKIINSYEQKKQCYEKENEVLSNLRDTLLPKLISGELRLDELDAVDASEVVDASLQAALP